jgi:PKD repeat protein
LCCGESAVAPQESPLRSILSVAFVLVLASSLAAQITTVVPTTTLAAETGNNTSAASTFTAQSNGNAGAGNISKVPSNTLLYPGSNTAIYAHFMGWFGQSNHMNVGYTSSDPVEVQAQVNDAISRGMAGFIEDWYGPNNAMPNNTLLALKSEAEARGGRFVFGIDYDGGALSNCNSTAGCDLTQQAISDLTYAYNTFEQSTAYFRLNSQPVVMFFDPDRYTTLNWPLIQSSVPGNPLFIFRNSGGFTHANTSGSYSWVIIDPTNPNNWEQSYLDDFYATGLKYPAEHTFGVSYKGFNDTLAVWTQNRVMNQQCGQVWLNTWNEVGKYYNASSQLESLQFVTWNDYEEGSELETGVDNCVSVGASISGSTLNWSISGGSETTIDHYTVFISTDGQNLMSLGDVPAGTHSLDLSSKNLASGSYTLYVKAVGRPSIVNKMSAGVSYTAQSGNQPPVAVLSVTPTSGIAPLTVSASTSGSTDPDGTVQSSSIIFGDGTVANGPTANHTYNTAGTYTLTATVTDNSGASSSTSKTVTVSPNVPPVVQLSVSPTSGVAPVAVTASTAGSTAPNGSIASTTINFGDGTIVSAVSATHTYSKAGVYTVTATVTDNLGISSSATGTVTAAGVVVTSPVVGTKAYSPVHFVAQAYSAAGITAMKIYVDYSSVYTVYTAQMNTYVSMKTGTHNVTVQAWDANGTVYKNSFRLTVN